MTFETKLKDILEEWYQYEEDKDYSILEGQVLKLHNWYVHGSKGKVRTSEVVRT